MKKVLIGLVVLIVLVFGGLKIFEITNYGGTTYYTKITNTGQRVTDRDDEGNSTSFMPMICLDMMRKAVCSS
ncbi:hypothetical protein AAULR_08066 [Lacticaseibacillus rhamnosus MTCC 5462]|nr:hypothetical protein AAULR_08066 [Lacticaseibacillus rhamnosus MTCC 5462]